MIAIPGYRILEKVDESPWKIVYRGIAELSGSPVTIETPNSENTSAQDIARFRHDYETAKQLDLEGIVRPLDLLHFGEGLALVSEDPGGESLKNALAPGKFGLADFLRIATKVTGILGEIHGKGVVHNDIRPSNIILDKGSLQVKIKGFGISFSAAENLKTSDAGLVREDLAYISPEQTGRINRIVDCRADFYSLGAVFYEMLTGQLPFQTSDPIEIIHCHIAKTPLPPADLSRDIQDIISEIIMKLLSKDPEDRYQNAAGIKADLEKCLLQLEETGGIEHFALASWDVPQRVEIPNRLYGREKETAALKNALERVCMGAAEMVLISGETGSGKTSLANEISRQAACVGFFISGKFDQFNRNIPYNALIRAFQGLAQRLLTGSEEDLKIWRERILHALGANSRIIIDVVPEIELVVGEQPPVPQTGLLETQNRFDMVLEKFIGVFAEKEHPLIMFLDDLQWADSATLRLIERVMTGPETRCLLLICAYRSDEVRDSHPLMTAMEKIREGGAVVNTISLSPLEIKDLLQLVADALKCGEDRARPFADLIYNNTGGNPFIVNQFLINLFREKTPEFDPFSGGAQSAVIRKWDAGKGAEFMSKRIQKLAEPAQLLLKQAACFGDSFDLEMLCRMNETPLEQAVSVLDEAVMDSLILPERNQLALTGNYRYGFAHDQIREAVYSLIAEDSRKGIHLRIGRFLMEGAGVDAADADIFNIANHINAGAGLVTSRTERDAYAKLNLTAGTKARDSAAFELALHYFSAGTGLLSEDTWKRRYDLACSLFMARSQCEYLCGNFEAAEKLLSLVLKNAGTKHDKALALMARMDMCIHRDDYKGAVKEGIKGLKALGLTVSTKPGRQAIKKEFLEIKQHLEGKNIRDLVNMPEMDSVDLNDVMGILANMDMPAHAVYQDLFTWSIFKKVNMTLRHGNTAVSSAAFMFFGLIIGSGHGDYKSAYEFGRLALELNEKFNSAVLRCRLNHIFALTINCWKSHAKTSIDYLGKAVQHGIECGDIVWASYAACNIVNYMFIKGDLLDGVYNEAQRCLNFAGQKEISSNVHYLKLVMQAVKNLKGKTINRRSFSDDAFDEDECEKYMRACQVRINTHLWFLHKLQSLYLFGYYDDAIRIAVECDAVKDASFGLIQVPEQYFYHSLTIAALYDSSGEAEKRGYWKTLRENRAKMKKWSDNCPENFLHKYLLISAEMARISGDDGEAMSFYEGAIKSARENEYAQNEAIACELAARFYMSRGFGLTATAYMTEAYHAYLRWGAVAKAGYLCEKYPGFFPAVSAEIRPGTQTAAAGAFDLAAIIRASQAISSEILLDRLLENLMKVVIENAGAQRGVLLLIKEGRAFIEAEGSIGKGAAEVPQPIPLESSSDLPLSVINYVSRVKKSVVLDDTSRPDMFDSDPYIINRRPRSMLCMPVLSQAKLAGILYLENRLTGHAFTPDRIETLEILSAQAAISLENARLYTEHKKAEHDKLELRAQLLQSQKMEAIGQLAGGVAHEVNNPVNSIANLAQLIIDCSGPESDEHMLAGRIMKETSRIVAIVKSLLSFSRHTEGKKGTVNVSDLIYEALSLAEPQLRNNGITLTVDIPADVPGIIAHRYQIEQVFLNIIGNAQHALNQRYNGAHKNKVLKISAGEATVDGCLFVRVIFYDSGTGIPAVIIDKVMTPFFTTKPAGVGTGLGLSICYGIISDHNGRFNIESVEGEYTKVTIDLPAVQLRDADSGVRDGKTRNPDPKDPEAMP